MSQQCKSCNLADHIFFSSSHKTDTRPLRIYVDYLCGAVSHRSHHVFPGLFIGPFRQIPKWWLHALSFSPVCVDTRYTIWFCACCIISIPHTEFANFLNFEPFSSVLFIYWLCIHLFTRTQIQIQSKFCLSFFILLLNFTYSSITFSNSY